MIRVHPVNLGQARAFVEKHHSHLSRPTSGLCAVGVAIDGALVCVAILGHPHARMLVRDGFTAEVTRVASDGTTPHAASMCLGAISRAALALGYRRLVSYTILGEPGTLYRACNWHPVARSGGGKGWENHPLAKEHTFTEQPGEKVRWEYGPDALPVDVDLDAWIRASVGAIVIPARAETMPLFRAAS